MPEIRIYRLALSSQYQSLALKDPALLGTSAFRFDCTSKADFWEPVNLSSKDTHKPEPNFWKLEGVTEGFVCDERIWGEMPILKMSCEALPMWFGNRKLYLVHIVEQGCWDALDTVHCVWPTGKHGVGTPSKYAFFPKRLGFTSVLAVPETCQHEMYVYTNDNDPITEFKADVERQKMTGLLFEEIWCEGSSEFI